MILSDISVKRPVFATVISLLLLAFGALSFMELPLREYPDTSSPSVSINTSYPGASAAVVETQVTQVIESQINGIAGIANISSSSSDGSSQISIDFEPGTDLEAGANDVREKISRVTRQLPEGVDPPQIQKANNDSQAIQFFSLTSSELSFLELNDYAERYVLDQFLVVDGVASLQVRGNGGFAMRVWLDRVALAARGLTVTDVTGALRRDNIEIPGGRVESSNMEFTVNVERVYRTPEDFRQLVVARGSDGHLVRLGEVARVELGADNERAIFRGNGVEAVGFGVIKQSTANSLDVMRATTALAEQLNATLPDHMQLILVSSDATFIENAIYSVYEAIFVTMFLVAAVIYLFLGSVKTTLIPVVTIPVCLFSAFILMAILGMSVNLITLLALVLSIGLVVDDSIVVLENIQRRVEEGEPPLLAAFRGSRQVAFAVIATTLVMVAIFVPVIFMDGSMGILLFEMAITIGGSIVFSMLLALTLTPMMASKLLSHDPNPGRLVRAVDNAFRWARQAYQDSLRTCLKYSWGVVGVFLLVGLCIYGLMNRIPQTFAPVEDQGLFQVPIQGPEGASIEFMERQVMAMQEKVLPYIETGEVNSVVAMVPGFGTNGGMLRVSLPNWDNRPKSTQEMMETLSKEWTDFPAISYNMFQRSGLTRGGGGNPVQFVIGGRSYEELVEWRDLIIERAEDSGLFDRPQSDYRQTRPALTVSVDKVRASDLGISIQTIGQTLQAMMSESRVTTFADAGEEYDVIVQAEADQRASPDDLTNIYVRSEASGQLIPLSNLVTVRNSSGPNSLNRYNQVRAITIQAGLAPGVTLDTALTFLEDVVRNELPDYAQIDYKGESADLKESGGDLAFIFGLSILVVFLVLAAQFESFVHPLVIMTTVPLAVFGALLGIFLTDGSLNVYSNIGLVILVGIATKNGILIVEFANQLRDEGKEFEEALIEASAIRLRPVLMTAIATIMGAVPLILSHGAGSESRNLLGIVIFAGVFVTTVMTLFVVPVVYKLLARGTGSPEAVARMLAKLEATNEDKSSHEPLKA
jgi:multidrug efflux pump